MVGTGERCLNLQFNQDVKCKAGLAQRVAKYRKGPGLLKKSVVRIIFGKVMTIFSQKDLIFILNQFGPKL